MANLHKQQATVHGALLFQMNDIEFQSFEKSPFYKEAISALISQMQAIESQKEAIRQRAMKLQVAEKDLDDQVDSLEKGDTTASLYEHKIMPKPEGKEEKISRLAELLFLTRKTEELVRQKAKYLSDHFKHGEETTQKMVDTFKQLNLELKPDAGIKTHEELADMLYQDSQADALACFQGIKHTPEMSFEELQQQFLNALKEVGHSNIEAYSAFRVEKLLTPRIQLSSNRDELLKRTTDLYANSWQERLRFDFDMTQNANLHEVALDQVRALQDRPQPIKSKQPSAPALSHADEMLQRQILQKQKQMQPEHGGGRSKEEEEELQKQQHWTPPTPKGRG